MNKTRNLALAEGLATLNFAGLSGDDLARSLRSEEAELRLAVAREDLREVAARADARRRALLARRRRKLRDTSIANKSTGHGRRLVRRELQTNKTCFLHNGKTICVVKWMPTGKSVRNGRGR